MIFERGDRVSHGDDAGEVVAIFGDGAVLCVAVDECGLGGPRCRHNYLALECRPATSEDDCNDGFDCPVPGHFHA